MTAPAVTGTATDHDAIVRVVHLYTAGFGKGDPGMFAEAFHPDAWIFFVTPDGQLAKGLLLDCFEEWATPPDGQVEGRVISVTQAGDVANVVLDFDSPAGPGESWLDLHNLIRIDGLWKITNKTATHSSRSGGVWSA